MAYNISNSNRGYIFLISAAKAIFLVVTAAYAINYCANYLTELALIPMYSDGKDRPSSGVIYCIFMGFVFLVGALLFVPFYRMREVTKSYPDLVIYGYIFAICGTFQFVLVLISMISVSSHIAGDHTKDSIIVKNLRDMHYLPVEPAPRPGPQLTAAASEDLCDANQIIIGYIPAIFYSNMFSIAFLELKSLTKISDDKVTKDWRIGFTVVFATFCSYLIIYIPFLIVILSQGDENAQARFNSLVITETFNAFMRMPNAFADPIRT